LLASLCHIAGELALSTKKIFNRLIPLKVSLPKHAHNASLIAQGIVGSWMYFLIFLTKA
jgi:hypothetical protein